MAPPTFWLLFLQTLAAKDMSGAWACLNGGKAAAVTTCSLQDFLGHLKIHSQTPIQKVAIIQDLHF